MRKFFILSFLIYNFFHLEITFGSSNVLKSPPNVPSPITRKTSKVVNIELNVQEKIGELIEGVQYSYWTFNGTVPGPMIRVRVGDTVKIKLNNPQGGRFPVALDIHGANIPLGGASISLTPPGKSATFSFKATRAGLFFYQSSAPPVAMQVANGLFGMIFVSPKNGLPAVDKEFYLVRSEFYTSGNFGNQGIQSFNMSNALAGKADYVVFNGSALSLVDKNSLKIKKGEKLRLFIGNIGPSLPATFRISGGYFTNALIPSKNSKYENKTLLFTPPGGTHVVDLSFDHIGDYRLLDQSILNSFNKGSLATIEVTGEMDKSKIIANKVDGLMQLEGSSPIFFISNKNRASTFQNSQSLPDRIARGRSVYMENCMACHQKDGRGIKGVFPPLAASDFLNKNKKRAISIVKNGIEGEIVVNGIAYNSTMAALKLSNEEIADVLTFLYNSWGNSKKTVRPAEVKSIISNY
ncbi:MAG: multicopper oxidase domain-containing protein [Halobacteriovoraceae bacterium]|jgi:nitrite reductase (NO-forming)|nr:multicopper oxidase domain-containing protein [Halobacteriovoraceae bacterium]